MYCIVLYCIVLKGWSLLPNALRPFQIYCAPPNLDIRIWICQLNVAQRPIFSSVRLFNEPEISCSGFLRPQKVHRAQPGLNLRTLDLEASTWPRDRLNELSAELQNSQWSPAVSLLIWFEFLMLSPICVSSTPTLYPSLRVIFPRGFLHIGLTVTIL